MSLDEDFQAFWVAYPRRVGKLAADKAYKKARLLDSAEHILAGVERYKRNKPDYADWCHPKTWLGQGRWLDEEDALPEAQARPECPHEPRCNSKTWCLTLQGREAEGWVRTEAGQWVRSESTGTDGA